MDALCWRNCNFSYNNYVFYRGEVKMQNQEFQKKVIISTTASITKNEHCTLINSCGESVLLTTLVLISVELSLFTKIM